MQGYTGPGKPLVLPILIEPVQDVINPAYGLRPVVAEALPSGGVIRCAGLHYGRRVVPSGFGVSMEIVHASDRALLVRLDHHRQVVSLARALERDCPAGVTSFSPAYSSVLLRYDPTTVAAESLQSWIAQASLVGEDKTESRDVVLPVVFDGPDLEEIAHAREMSTVEVIDIFCRTVYRVYFFGFVPGFAYMGDVDERIAMPRRAAPRKAVPAGSVGIAGRQTGVYPVETPGGWNLIGRCTAPVFDAARQPACLLQVGDMVRFQPA